MDNLFHDPDKLEQAAFRLRLLKSPGRFLAYCALRRAARHCHNLMRGRPTVVGLVLPEGADQTVYVKAAQAFVYQPGARGRTRTGVLSATRKSKSDRFDSIDLGDAMEEHDRLVVLAESREALPDDFDLVADAVVDVGPVLPRHVKAAAWLCLRQRVTDEEAAVVAAMPLDTVAMAFRPGRSFSAAVEAVRRAEEEKARAAREAVPLLGDLFGLGEAGEWGRELATDFADWKAGRIGWEDVDRGVLVSGPPGTGKTTFAKALAATCGVHLVLGSMGRWQAKGHLGDMLKAMRAAFDEARRNAPSIVFLDEVDAAGDRERFHDHNRDYDVKVVAALLECIDGAEGREGVVVVGACNHPHRLDAALVRPGRLDRHVRIPYPDTQAREGILRFHLRGGLEGCDLSSVAGRTEGLTGADLEQLVRQARRHARRARRPMDLADLEKALPARTRLPGAVVRRSAVHEAGHALIGLAVGLRLDALVLMDSFDPSGSSTQVGGGARFEFPLVTERTRQEFLDRICLALGGLAAEEVVYGCRGAGGGGYPGSDLHLATMDALLMEATYGLGGGLAYLSSEREEDLLATLRLNPEVRKRVNEVLGNQFRRARNVLQGQRAELERLAGELYAKRALSPDEVEALSKLCR